MDGANASTNFVDSGPNALAVTAVGNAQVSTAQSKYGGASGYFDGTGDYVSIPNSSLFAFGSGDFTIEFWLKTTDTAGGLLNLTGGTTGYWQLSLYNGSLYWQTTRDTTNLHIISATSVLDGAWHHIAVTRQGTTNRVYFDGSQAASATDSTNYSGSGGSLFIGRDSAGSDLNAYIDDLRISRFARYVSNFTPPAAALPDIYNPNTSLPVSGAALWLAGDDSSTLYTDAGSSAVTKSGDLVYQWSDKSGNSRNATQATSGNRPTWVAPANARNNLGAVGFDGTSQFLNLASDPIGANDYTIEFWMKQEATTASYWVILDSRVSGNAIGYPVILYNNSSTALSFYNNGWLLSATVSVSTWTHVAITRSSGTIRMFINGSIASSGTDTSSYNTFRQLGKAFDPYYFKGQIQNLIIYKGQALYTANFTPFMS